MVGIVIVRSDHGASCRERARLIALCIALVLVPGCLPHNSGLPPTLRAPQLRQNEPASGIHHNVKPGETLRGIARTYSVDIQRLAEVNNLSPPFAVKSGMRLFIPGAVRERAPEGKTVRAHASRKVEDRAGTLAWPVKGRIVSEFGVKDGIQRNGVEIESKTGAPVRAAADGRIGYAGQMKGYGRVVIIEHKNRLLTVYAHLGKHSPALGTKVAKGEVIGYLGASDHRDTSSLYFEVRSRSKPRNPRFFLPKES